MPFKTFTNWLFDGSSDSPIPKAGNMDLTKPSSPISQQFVIKMFLRNGPLNSYLNEYFNNVGVWYLDKEELFKFVKKCVIDFKVNRRDIVYYKRSDKSKLFDLLSVKFPYLKKDDVYLLIDEIEKSEDKDGVYNALGLEAPKKRKVRTGKKTKKGKVTLEEFLAEHFSLYREVPSKN